MELNTSQIEYLFEFVESKNVKYYDVQHEIVDHLASSIESLMANDENITFEQALDKTYNKYPITGFAVYTLELEKSVSIFWMRKIFSTITSGYGLPLILLLLMLTKSIYMQLIMHGNTAVTVIYVTVTALALIAFAIFGRQFGKSSLEMMLYGEFFIYDDNINDRLLYYRVLKIITSAMIFIPVVLSRLSCIFAKDMNGNFDSENAIMLYTLSFFTSISVYWSLCVIFYFPKMIRNVIADKYNHVVIA